MFPRNIWFVFTPVWFKYTCQQIILIFQVWVKTDLFSKFSLTLIPSEISDNFYFIRCRILSTSDKTLNELKNLTFNNQFLPHPIITDLSDTGTYTKGSLKKQAYTFLDLKLYFLKKLTTSIKMNHNNLYYRCTLIFKSWRLFLFHAK